MNFFQQNKKIILLLSGGIIAIAIVVGVLFKSYVPFINGRILNTQITLGQYCIGFVPNTSPIVGKWEQNSGIIECVENSSQTPTNSISASSCSVVGDPRVNNCNIYNALIRQCVCTNI